MILSQKEVEEFLPEYILGIISEDKKIEIDLWRKESSENEKFFKDYLKTYDAFSLLNEMKHFNPFEALKKVNSKIEVVENKGFWIRLQRVAAVLIIPLLVYSGYLALQNITLKKHKEEFLVMQTIRSRQGMVSEFSLPDGTKVWLNSDSELRFPTYFNGRSRDVNLNGEAFFDVTKNEKQPFRINANGLDVEVLGTSLNIISYEDEPMSEIVLVEGKVSLSFETEEGEKKSETIIPGQRAVFLENSEEIVKDNVNTDKYISWKDGNLIFREDSMEDVIRRLSHWFNVTIIVDDPEINEYVYNATFRNEKIQDVLSLLKISAPIDYKFEERKLTSDGEFTKQIIYLMKKKK